MCWFRHRVVGRLPTLASARWFLHKPTNPRHVESLSPAHDLSRCSQKHRSSQLVTLHLHCSKNVRRFQQKNSWFQQKLSWSLGCSNLVRRFQQVQKISGPATPTSCHCSQLHATVADIGLCGDRGCNIAAVGFKHREGCGCNSAVAAQRMYVARWCGWFQQPRLWF